jgi:ABC-type sugar transport system permease subunit
MRSVAWKAEEIFMFQRARRKLVIPFLLPQTILYLIFMFAPLVMTVIYGFTNWRGHGMEWRVTGIQNFRIILKDGLFLNAMKNSFYLVIVGGILLFLPAMGMAWSLHQRIRGKQVFRFVILAPVVLSVSVAGLMWKWMYNPVFGLISPLLEAIGLGKLALAWMGNPDTALTAVIIASIWHGIGTWVLLLSAGLERIPPDLPEAAEVDGASDWQVFRFITVPLMWEVLRILLVLWVMQALQAFTFVYVMTGPTGVGGPMRSTELMATYVFKNAFTDFKWAYATALATTMMAMIFVLSTFTNRAMMRESVEY